MQEKGCVQQIDAHDAQRLLLKSVLIVEHSDMHDHFAVRIARVSLKFHAHPAVALISALIVARRDGVGESKESRAVSTRRP